MDELELDSVALDHEAEVFAMGLVVFGDEELDLEQEEYVRYLARQRRRMEWTTNQY
jgi:hypothetical protein